MDEPDDKYAAASDWQIRPLVASDHDQWLPLWHQYLAYHGVWPEDAPAET